MSKVSSSSVQPVATIDDATPKNTHAKKPRKHKSKKRNQESTVGYATGAEYPIGNHFDDGFYYVRERLPPSLPGSDQFSKSRQILTTLVNKLGIDPASEGGQAKVALDTLAAAEKMVEKLPKNHREIARKILILSRWSGLYEATAILRNNGAPLADFGRDEYKKLERIRSQKTDAISPHRIRDSEHFQSMDSLTQGPEKLGELKAAIKTLFPELAREKLANIKRSHADEYKQADALRVRWRARNEQSTLKKS